MKRLHAMFDHKPACGTVLDLLRASRRDAFTTKDGEAVSDAAGNRI